ncbi:MAG: stage II sporulation protein R [Eubacteriales bacterium]
MTKLKYIEKALLIGFVIAILFSFTSFTAFAAQCEQIPNEVFRLHVLANSDSEEDQALKLKVRDRLLDETGTLFSECTTKEEAMSAAKANIAYLEQVAQDEIYKQGYTYECSQKQKIYFFNNMYSTDGITMPAGNYTMPRAC